jgi:molybdenum-dependent DNA-binding transcriptional regulator ModE
VEEQRPEKKNQKVKLARAIARGGSITAWARKNNVPVRTAYRWARDRKVREASDMWRRTVLSQAIGRMVRCSTSAVAGMERLAKGADSEAVRLRAWRAILADQMAMARFSTLEHRMTELEEERDAQRAQQPFYKR